MSTTRLSSAYQALSNILAEAKILRQLVEHQSGFTLKPENIALYESYARHIRADLDRLDRIITTLKEA